MYTRRNYWQPFNLQTRIVNKVRGKLMLASFRIYYLLTFTVIFIPRRITHWLADG